MIFYARVEGIAKAKGVSMAQVALAWALAKDGKFLILKIQRSLTIFRCFCPNRRDYISGELD